MSGLLSLPPEVIEQFGPYLNNKEVAGLRYTCVDLANIFTPFLLDALTLRVGHTITTLSSPPRISVPFIPIPTRLAPYIKNLDIGLSHWEHLEHQQLPLLPVVREEIAKLISVTCLRLSWISVFSRDNIESKDVASRRLAEQTLLFDVIEATGGGLEDLRLENSFMLPQVSTSPPLLSCFSSLKKLTLQIEDGDSTGRAGISTAKEVLAHSSNLEFLNIKWESYQVHDTIAILDLLPSRSSAERLPLLHLRLHGRVECLSAFPITDTPALSGLQHLSILQSDTVNDLDRFWDLLTASHICLRYLQFEHCVSPALVRYLTSFSGIEVLFMKFLITSRSHSLEESIPHILQSHSATLTQLSLQAPACLYSQYEDEGRPFHIAWPSQTVFTNLKRLRTSNPSGWKLNATTCQKFLDWLEHFPALEHVYTDWIEHAYPINLQRDAIADLVVGRTGRPSYWTFDFSCFSRLTWKIQPYSQQEWRLRAVPMHHERNSHWDISYVDYYRTFGPA